MGDDIWSVHRDGLTVLFTAITHQIAPGQLAEARDQFEGLLINRLLISKWQKIFSIDLLARGNCFCNTSQYLWASLVIGLRLKNEEGLLVTIDQKL